MCSGAGGQGSAVFECLCFEGGNKVMPEVLRELSPRMKEKNGWERDLSAPLKEAGWLSLPWLRTDMHKKDLAEQVLVERRRGESERERQMLVRVGAAQGLGTLTPRTAQPCALWPGCPVSILCSGSYLLKSLHKRNLECCYDSLTITKLFDVLGALPFSKLCGLEMGINENYLTQFL